MSVPLINTQFNAGELSPALYGRVDLAKYKAGCFTLRNMFCAVGGGASSRPGTKFCGQSKQSGTDVTPVLIPFQFSIEQGYALEFGDRYMRVIANGGFVTDAIYTLTSVTNNNPGVFTAAPNGPNYAVGDWIFLSGMTGMTALNNGTFIIDTLLGTDVFTLRDPLTGVPVNTILLGTYNPSSGTSARIFTLDTPYASEDLQLLKWTQSADVMTLCHPNYPPTDLTRIAANDWQLTTTTFSTSIVAPTTASVSASVTTSTTSQMTTYQFVITAIDSTTGEESVASPIATVTNSVDIATTLGSLTVSWAPVTGSEYYNIYKAIPSIGTGSIPVGAIFGYDGSSFGTQFVDTNITQDLTVTPPLHLNPFAPGQIQFFSMSATGSSYTSQPTITVSTVSGSGLVTQAVVQNGGVNAIIVVNSGQNYTAGETVNITGGGGSGAAATMSVGPLTGTYPGCVAYFQDRRYYANTLNNPDTYFASQPGAFTNMDRSIPTDASDAIVGTPWAQQVNGIQAMVPMPGGLVILTGLGAWQLSGGAVGTPVTPANQQATPQAYNGCHQHILPITINYDILYVQTKGSIVRDLNYNFFANIYTGIDLTVLSTHLFTGRQIERWAWAEEPWKLVWAVLDNGTALSLTYLKEQDIWAWARHDTFGLFTSVCSVTEPPVDAPYFVVKRFIPNINNPVYYIERMNDRLWGTVEDSWCLDSALSYDMPAPNAELMVSSATGGHNITSYNLIIGGSGYVAPIGQIKDLSGPGTGASVLLVVSGGVIVSATPVSSGQGYVHPVLEIQDSAGVGAVIQPIVTDFVTLRADAAVFVPGDVGKIVRSGGGRIEITAYAAPDTLIGDIIAPITTTIPNDPNNTPVPAISGTWTMTRPTATLSGLFHFEGMTLSALADGGVVHDLEVLGGQTTLSTAASAIVVGLPFTAQLQTPYLEAPGGATMQSRRKSQTQAVLRVQNSRAPSIGTNQPDAAAQPDFANIPWTGMTQIKDRTPQDHAGLPIPLFSGDYDITNLAGTWDTRGQLAIEQKDPVPLTALAAISWIQVGDTPG